jgi:hypothetical protein
MHFSQIFVLNPAISSLLVSWELIEGGMNVDEGYNGLA